MRLSIIIPVYNVAAFLSECLDSVFSQNLDDCEVICVNDGSTDNSGDLLTEYKEKQSTLIIINRENAGLSAARNTGLKVATGDYVYFLDSDDYLYERSLERMLRFMIDNELEVGCFNVLKDGFADYYSTEFQPAGVFTGTEFCYKFRDFNGYFYPAPVWMFMYKRDFLLSNNLSFVEGRVHEDEEYTPRVLFCANRMSVMNFPVQFHRVTRVGAITSTVTVKHLKDSTANCRSVYVFMQNHKNVAPVFYEAIFSFYLLTLLKACNCGFGSKRKEFFTNADMKIMYACSQNEFEQKCAKLAGISLGIFKRYFENRYSTVIIKIINRFL